MRFSNVFCLAIIATVFVGLPGCDSTVHNNSDAVVARDGLMPTGDSLVDADGKVTVGLRYVSDQTTAKDVPDRTVSYEPLSNFRKAGATVYIPGAGSVMAEGGSTMANADPPTDSANNDNEKSAGESGSLWGKISGGLKKLTGGGK